MNQEIEILRVYARSFYDFQEVKNEFSNRLRALEADGKLSRDVKDERAKEIMEYEKKLTAAENGLLRIVESHLDPLPIYSDFLRPIRGCAVRMSACIIMSIGDITRFATVSKLWAYSGLHVIDGRAARRKKGEKSNWNSFLKTKLFVLSDCLMKLNINPETKQPLRYRKFYDDYKNRMTNRAACNMTKEQHSKKAISSMQPIQPLPSDGEATGKLKSKAIVPSVTWLPNGCTKGHVHAMSLRYIQKMFLQDLWLRWWELEAGAPPTRPYSEAVLGRVHGEYPKPLNV